MQGNERPMKDELLTPAEVARIFRVDPKTVSRWAIAGKISSVRTLGGHRRFYRSEVERAMSTAIHDAEIDRDFVDADSR
jgi:excisionase family DNA binding protein